MTQCLMPVTKSGHTHVTLSCGASVPHALARYQYVDIDQNNQKDKKKLKPGLENFLPPDAARNAFKGVVSRKRA